MARQAIATIDPHVDALPGHLRFVYPRIRDEQWLQSYREVDEIGFALANISRRFSRRPHLEGAARHLIDSRVELERRFEQFMPDVIRFANVGQPFRLSVAPEDGRLGGGPT